MKKLSIVAVDDEQDAVSLLKLELAKMPDLVEKVDCFTNPYDTIKYLNQNKTDVLLLDVEMPQLNGFELLDMLRPVQCSIIFITAYDRYAIKAFRYHALDYITKPVDSDLLKLVILKAAEKKWLEIQQKEWQRYMQKRVLDRLALTTSKGVVFVDLKEICCIEASDSYSIIHLKNGNKIINSRSLKEMEYLVEENDLVRVHRQYIVNLREIIQLNRTEGTLTLSNDMTVSVSREQKDMILDRFRR